MMIDVRVKIELMSFSGGVAVMVESGAFAPRISTYPEPLNIDQAHESDHFLIVELELNHL